MTVRHRRRAFELPSSIGKLEEEITAAGPAMPKQRFDEQSPDNTENVSSHQEGTGQRQLLTDASPTRPRFGFIVGVSQKMQEVYKLIATVSRHHYPVLILGETGTGKELAARSIHAAGPRKDMPFVPVDCSALVPTLIESELFGHVKGAFTGATYTKRGLFEAAEGGTLFLDEIGELPVSLQSKLLRVLQEREVKPVGATERKSINVRVIAATNRDFLAAISSGVFRQDLYYRLNVVQIKIPPLRERRSDIPLLVSVFTERFFGERDSACTISEEAMRRLMDYDWPGNVRELENAIERAVALASSEVLDVNDLPLNVAFPTGHHLPNSDEVLSLEELERRTILQALSETGGDRLAAARRLGIGKTTIYRKLEQYRKIGSNS